MALNKKDLDDLTYQINGAAIEVHKAVGPRLLENVYHQCLKHELNYRGISFESELIVPVQYKMVEIETTLRCDLLIESAIVVELKSVAN